MKRVVILTTGGTIAMRADPRAGGAMPALAGVDLAAALPTELAQVATQEFANLPSAHLTLDQIWALSRRVAALVAEAGTDGIVVTHGTDTLEESAYLCDLTVDSDKPVVFTGAMRTSSDIGYDGLTNLADAVRIASDDDARGLGTLVVFNGEIHTARDVTKTHTTALGAFRSPGFGPLGYVDAGRVAISRRLARREFIPAVRLEPNVHLLKLAVGMGDDLLVYLADTVGARGIVLETLGGGRVLPGWLSTLQHAIEKDCAILITSRVGAGRTFDRYGYAGAHRDLARLGCWFAGSLNGQKARIKLMAALGAGNANQYFKNEA